MSRTSESGSLNRFFLLSLKRGDALNGLKTGHRSLNSIMANFIFTWTLLRCSFEMSAPMKEPSSLGSPTLSFVAPSTNASTNSSKMASSTKMRDVQRQISPWKWNAEKNQTETYFARLKQKTFRVKILQICNLTYATLSYIMWTYEFHS